VPVKDYLTTLAALTRAQLAAEVQRRLVEFNRVEERREPWEEIEDCRQRYRLALREEAKRGERK
jgi:hypothetical protein